MNKQSSDPLLLAGKILTIVLQGIVAFGAAIMALLIPVILLFQDRINAEIAAEHPELVGSFPAYTLAGMFALLIAIIVLAFLFFGKLRAIIATVGEREPFVPENAERLNLMAWLLLAIQIVKIPMLSLLMVFAQWMNQIETDRIKVDSWIDLSSILMVIVLFILARVFKHGAAMREDLEGTV